MAAQRAVYYFRVARKVVHAVQAQHLDALMIAKREGSGGVRVSGELVSCQRSTSDASSRLGQRTYSRFPLKHAYVWALLKPL